MNDKTNKETATTRRLEAIQPIVSECEKELDLIESQVTELNGSLEKKITSLEVSSDDSLPGSYPRLFLRRRPSEVLTLSTASLEWRFDNVTEELRWTGAVDWEGVIHQCTDDGNYTQENFEDALPDVDYPVIEQFCIAEGMARELRSRLHAIADFERAVGEMLSLH